MQQGKYVLSFCQVIYLFPTMKSKKRKLKKQNLIIPIALQKRYPNNIAFANWTFNYLYAKEAEYAIMKKAGTYSADPALRKMALVDPQIAALLKIRTSFIFSRRFRIKGGRKKIRTFIEETLKNVKDDSFVRMGLSYSKMLVNGINFTYLNWQKTDDGKYWTIKSIEPLEGILRYENDYSEATYIEYQNNKIHRDNFFIIANEATIEKPYGISPLIPCFFWYWYKIRIIKAWTIYLAKYAEPKLLITDEMVDDGASGMKKTPWQANPIQMKTFVEQLEKIENYSALQVPVGINIKQLKIDPMSNNHFELFMKKANEEIAKVLIGNPSLVEKLTGGSYAAIKEQSEIVQVIPFMDLGYMERNIQQQIIDPLAKFNFIIRNPKEIPTFTIERDSPNVISEEKRIMFELIKYLKEGYEIYNEQEIYERIIGMDLEIAEKKEEDKAPLPQSDTANKVDDDASDESVAEDKKEDEDEE